MNDEIADIVDNDSESAEQLIASLIEREEDNEEDFVVQSSTFVDRVRTSPRMVAYDSEAESESDNQSEEESESESDNQSEEESESEAEESEADSESEEESEAEAEAEAEESDSESEEEKTPQIKSKQYIDVEQRLLRRKEAKLSLSESYLTKLINKLESNGKSLTESRSRIYGCKY